MDKQFLTVNGCMQRIKNVLNVKTPSQVMIAVTVAFVVVLGVGFAVNRANKASNSVTASSDEEISDNPRTLDDAIIWYLKEKEADKYLKGQYFASSYRILDTILSSERVTVFTHILCEWISLDGETVSGGAGLTSITFRVGSNGFEYEDSTYYPKPDALDIPQKAKDAIANPVYFAEMRAEADKDINDFLESLPPSSINLETAITQAVLEANKSGYNPGDFSTESHTTLAIAEEAETVTVYLMVLYENYGFSEGGFSELGGSHMPVAITFDKRTNSGLTMTEYWTPRDGAYYVPSIKEKFPPEAYEDALDTQKYIYAHKMSCYEQAIEYGDVDTDLQIASLIETICLSPAQASNPEVYIEAHSIDFRELVYYGRYTLDYCFDLFEKGGQTGLEGQIMANACRDIMTILGETVVEGNFYTGQEWYDAQRAYREEQKVCLREIHNAIK